MQGGRNEIATVWETEGGEDGGRRTAGESDRSGNEMAKSKAGTHCGKRNCLFRAYFFSRFQKNCGLF